ncbi:hypothetical protein BDA96_08G180800 [Sorghum bicolor]|uniref:Transmembrane protein n=2 Tax=Sorghum bicolor TaxID=4558 RepID=A0A1Z5R734_SORBI|nr:hypothetical protein BDA96_08G180800 [Sorghum bicolor]OQU79573.1 hypothetical protein SORBI_3008G164201 [Sorghum bicolor]
MLGFPAGAGGPPPPPRQKDGIEMVGDPATFHHVALDIPVVDRKSDGHTAAAVGEIHPAYGEHQQFENCLTEDCLTWCAKTMFKILFIIVVVSSSFFFIQNFATTKMTWTQALQMIVFLPVLGVIYVMALVTCWPDATCCTVPEESSAN